jgi:hypothetical protein
MENDAIRMENDAMVGLKVRSRHIIRQAATQWQCESHTTSTYLMVGEQRPGCLRKTSI